MLLIRDNCITLEDALTIANKRIKELEAENAELKRERDAAVADIHKTCSTCKHYYYNRQDDDTRDCLWFDCCKIEDHWEWCGVPEPPKEEEIR